MSEQLNEKQNKVKSCEIVGTFKVQIIKNDTLEGTVILSGIQHFRLLLKKFLKPKANWNIS